MDKDGNVYCLHLAPKSGLSDLTQPISILLIYYYIRSCIESAVAINPSFPGSPRSNLGTSIDSSLHITPNQEINFQAKLIAEVTPALMCSQTTVNFDLPLVMCLFWMTDTVSVPYTLLPDRTQYWLKSEDSYLVRLIIIVVINLWSWSVYDHLGSSQNKRKYPVYLHTVLITCSWNNANMWSQNLNKTTIETLKWWTVTNYIALYSGAES